jgi:hypothetical protein
MITAVALFGYFFRFPITNVCTFNQLPRPVRVASGCDARSKLSAAAATIANKNISSKKAAAERRE